MPFDATSVFRKAVTKVYLAYLFQTMAFGWCVHKAVYRAESECSLQSKVNVEHSRLLILILHHWMWQPCVKVCNLPGALSGTHGAVHAALWQRPAEIWLMFFPCRAVASVGSRTWLVCPSPSCTDKHNHSHTWVRKWVISFTHTHTYVIPLFTAREYRRVVFVTVSYESNFRYNYCKDFPNQIVNSQFLSAISYTSLAGVVTRSQWTC